MTLAVGCLLLAACDSRGAGSGTPPPTAPPIPIPPPGGCEYESRSGTCRIAHHEIADANDGVFDHVVVRATYEWTGDPRGVVGFKEWPTSRALAPSLEASVAAIATAPCQATVLVRGSCPPQTSMVTGVEVTPPPPASASASPAPSAVAFQGDETACKKDEDCRPAPSCCPAPCTSHVFNAQAAERASASLRCDPAQKCISAGGCRTHAYLCVRKHCKLVYSDDPDYRSR